MLIRILISSIGAASLTVCAPSSGEASVATSKLALRKAVGVYSRAFLSGNSEMAFGMLSPRCQDRIDFAEFDEYSFLAMIKYGNQPIKTYRAIVRNGRAKVTYTYADSDLNQHDESWVKRDGRWRYDDC